ncbi:MAG: ribosome small subunit-dependent GTPase A [bacterium]|jgi:ribosome biogenesis GTPase
MQLYALGWDSGFEESFREYRSQNLLPARIAREHKSLYLVYAERGEFTAKVRGKLRYEAGLSGEMPAVGDWVAVRPMDGEARAIIHGVLPRKSAFLRKVAWVKTESQVLAANIDTAFLVMGLASNFNLRRLERYLTLAWESGARPVVILNKADLCDDVEAKIGEVGTIAFDIPTHAVSAREGTGLEAIEEYLGPGKTAVLLGSSGVGKSTLINRLLGMERQATGEVREADGRGRHVTTSRELVMLPGGGVLIDTPGLRELQMWADEDSVKGSFEDIEALAGGCRFRDCTHESEPGCAVKQAIESGDLDDKRFSSYKKIKRELNMLAVRKDQRARLDQKNKQKQLAKRIRQMQRFRRKR